MPATEPGTILGYIQDAADLVFQFTEGKSFSDYERDIMLRSAVERQFITIGESVNLLSKAQPESMSRISNRRRIIGLRNHLAHVFFDIDDSIVWLTTINRLPILRTEVTELIQEYERR